MDLVICHLRIEEKGKQMKKKYKIINNNKGLYTVKRKIPILPIWVKCRGSVLNGSFHTYSEAEHFIKYLKNEITFEEYLEFIKRWWYYYV